MFRLVLFDFDGTLIKGDSTKLAFKSLFRSKFSFLIGYYLSHIMGLMVLIITGKDNYLRESRRIVLASRLDDLKQSEFISQAQNSIFEQVHSKAINYMDSGNRILIISAGYSEIIQLILGNNLKYELIANSLFLKEPEVINFEKKVLRLKLKVKSNYHVRAAYGNTKGDIPMLKIADRAYWVNKNGEISEFNC